MEYMKETGFLGTKAPLFMDEITVIVALLPFLVGIAVFFAKNKMYKVHSILQLVIYIFSVIVIFYFEYGVRSYGGFESFIKDNPLNHNYLGAVLIIHIAIAVATLIVWSMTIFKAPKRVVMKKHKKDGMVTFVAITLTSLTGIWVYLILFLY